MSEFKKITILDKEYTAMKLASEGYEMPPSVMHNARTAGLRVTSGGVESFPWYGVTKDREGQYVLLESSHYEDITTISTIHRDRALDLVRKIATGLRTAGRSFPDLLTGIFPLYRILIEGGENIVLLPPDCGSLLTLSRTPEETDRTVRALIVPDREKSFTLTLELVQLLYYAVSGRLPYEREDVRGSGFRPYDLSLYGYESLVTSFIMDTLSMSEKRERKICLNWGEQYPLGWFLENTEKLEWNFPSRSESDRIFDVERSENSEEFSSLRKKKSIKAKRKKFIREKGAKILVIALVAVVVFYFIGNYAYEKLRPPRTKDLSPEGIIEYTIEKQNELDAASINEGFKGDCAQYMEVTSLYVTSRTSMAYTQKNSVVSYEEWNEGGRGAIEDESVIYGVTIRNIEKTGDESYRAHLTYYTPYALKDEDEEKWEKKDGYSRLFVYSIDENFVFEWNRKGWWLCTSSSFGDDTLLDVLYVPYAAEGEITSY